MSPPTVSSDMLPNGDLAVADWDPGPPGAYEPQQAPDLVETELKLLRIKNDRLQTELDELKARCAHLLRLHGESDCAVSQDSLNDGLKVSQAVASRPPTNIDARGSNHTNAQGDVHYNYSLVTIKSVGSDGNMMIVILVIFWIDGF